jgi:hypothetical protein
MVAAWNMLRVRVGACVCVCVCVHACLHVPALTVTCAPTRARTTTQVQIWRDLRVIHAC